MFPDTSYGHMHVSTQGTLRIQGVQREDDGFLVCSALSVAGSNTVRAFLQVLNTYLRLFILCIKVLRRFLSDLSCVSRLPL